MESMLVKVVLVPGLVGVASWAGRRWGPAISGWVGALPLTSAPVVLLLGIEQGLTFAASAAKGALFGVVPLTVFVAIYGALLRRWPWWVCVLAGCTTYLVVAAMLRNITLPLLVVFACSILSVGIVTLTLPHPNSRHPSRPSAPAWDIPARMGAALVMVLLITGFAERLGPEFSGLLTPFPVVASILAGFTHRSQGRDPVTQVLRALTLGSLSFGVFFLLLASLLQPWGLVRAGLVSAVGTAAVHKRVLTHLKREAGEGDRPAKVEASHP